MKRTVGIVFAAIALMGAKVAPSPNLGKAAAACRPGEPGPALLIAVNGFKDRKGLLRVELYPANDTDFLAPDFELVSQGKTFGRVDLQPIPGGPVVVCVRVPAPGRYSISMLHDRDRNLKFGLFSDGVGFPGTPKLSRSKPKSAVAAVTAGSGLSRVNVTLQYLRGFGFGPIKSK